jgi:guanosine-3',5'-bis(diphosphate) 3'-pyrophosphohydrolase
VCRCQVKDLLSKVRTYLPADKVQAIQEAYLYAEECHIDQLRASGEPYVAHPLNTALQLADMRLDAATLQAALLHDVMEDCGVSYQTLHGRFGDDVARLVDGVTKLNKIERRNPKDDWNSYELGQTEEQAENLRKMLVAMAEDIRVVLIKLADRFHNMRTLNALPSNRQTAIAQETLDIFAPLAHRLGMWDMKWRLEDMAFQVLQPERYKDISRLLRTKRTERERYISQVTNLLEVELRQSGVSAAVTGRPKHIFSIYKKMKKYEWEGKEFGQIYDLFAVRILVKEARECYSALGVVHGLWRPLPAQFDDYIGNPKENLYQALHTIVLGPGGVPLEIQIRTRKMHQLAEYGVAAHWRYKEGSGTDMRFEEKMAWLRQLLEWQRDVVGAEEFLESVKTDIFRDQVFVYTPKGEIKELPAGSTPIDFAYRIHTDLGHHCVGSKINGKLVTLDYQIKNGDTVEILTTKLGFGPSLDWLNPNMGYVKSADARAKIRQWLRRQASETNVQRGRDLLQRELRRLGIEVDEVDAAGLFKFDNVEEMLVALGNGTIDPSQVILRLTAHSESTQSGYTGYVASEGLSSEVEVLGAGDLATRMGRCCGPLPGDQIVGFITQNQGVTVHRKDCAHVSNDDEVGRLVSVEWGQTQTLYPTRLRVEAWDRVGLLRDVGATVSAEKVNIASLVTTENQDENAFIYLTLYTTGVDQLSRLFTKLEAVPGVINVSRSISPDHQKSVVREPIV